MNTQHFTLAVHGGCGDIIKGSLSAEDEEAYLQGLRDSLNAGKGVLEKAGSSLEAVEAAIASLEENPVFNAGKGSVFNNDGQNEMDASIMDGSNHEAGAIAGVKNLRNPIKGAKLVKDHSNHVFLIGPGAENFCREQCLQFEDPEWFFTQKRWDQFQKALKNKEQFMDHSAGDDNHGTVGAVAMDNKGNLASGSSTGGITNKNSGRVGDSAIIGGGIYADNQSCAVSCTGEGEYFIRSVAAYNVVSGIQLGHLSLEDASVHALQKVKQLGGEGGLIAIDALGNIALPFITKGMYRGFLRGDQNPYVAIYGKND